MNVCVYVFLFVVVCVGECVCLYERGIGEENSGPEGRADIGRDFLLTFQH